MIFFLLLAPLTAIIPFRHFGSIALKLFECEMVKIMRNIECVKYQSNDRFIRSRGKPSNFSISWLKFFAPRIHQQQFQSFYRFALNSFIVNLRHHLCRSSINLRGHWMQWNRFQKVQCNLWRNLCGSILTMHWSVCGE